MKYYDFKIAKKIILKYADRLSEAVLGIEEDWGNTSATIWKGGKFIDDYEQEIDLEDLTELVGISGSEVGIPVLRLYLLDGKELFYEMHTCDKPKNFIEKKTEEVNVKGIFKNGSKWVVERQERKKQRIEARQAYREGKAKARQKQT